MSSTEDDASVAVPTNLNLTVLLINHLSQVSGDADYSADSSCSDSPADEESNVVVVADHQGHGGGDGGHDHHHHGMMAMLGHAGKMIMGTIKPLMHIAKMMNPFKLVN